MEEATASLTSLVIKLLQDLANDLANTLERLHVVLGLLVVGVEVTDRQADCCQLWPSTMSSADLLFLRFSDICECSLTFCCGVSVVPSSYGIKLTAR